MGKTVIILVIVAAFIAGSITSETLAYAAKGESQGQPFQEISKKLDDLKSQIKSLIGDVTRHEMIIDEITDKRCPAQKVVGGFGSNGEVICVTDEIGQQGPFNVITRTFPVEIAANGVFSDELFCNEGEIIIGGKIEGPDTISIFSGNVDNGIQSYGVTVRNNNPTSVVIVNVILSCLEST